MNQRFYGIAAAFSFGALVLVIGWMTAKATLLRTPVAPAKVNPPVTPVSGFIAEGVAARYQRKDIAAAEKAWREALPLLDRPGVTAMERYQVNAGLGLIEAERQEYAKARDYFRTAVAASREITDNRKPLAYSHYNLACTEAQLGNKDAAFADLRVALETERQTKRQVYKKMFREDDSLSPLKVDPRFLELIQEFAELTTPPEMKPKS